VLRRKGHSYFNRVKNVEQKLIKMKECLQDDKSNLPPNLSTPSLLGSVLQVKSAYGQFWKKQPRRMLNYSSGIKRENRPLVDSLNGKMRMRKRNKVVFQIWLGEFPYKSDVSKYFMRATKCMPLVLRWYDFPRCPPTLICTSFAGSAGEIGLKNYGIKIWKRV